MSEEGKLERQLRKLLSGTVPLTIQDLEDEIIDMLAYLSPLPIRMERVEGVVVGDEDFLLETDGEYDAGEDTAYRWDVSDLRRNGASKFFVVALYEALQCRTEGMLEEQLRV